MPYSSEPDPCLKRECCCPSEPFYPTNSSRINDISSEAPQGPDGPAPSNLAYWWMLAAACGTTLSISVIKVPLPFSPPSRFPLPRCTPPPFRSFSFWQFVSPSSCRRTLPPRPFEDKAATILTPLSIVAPQLIHLKMV